MQLGDEFRVEVRAPSPGSFDVSVEVDGAWSVTNRSAAPRSLDAVARVHRIHDVAGALRIFRHGYQSWSACGVATFGVDVDPSRATGSRALSRGMHHADPQVTEPGELRSEAVTALGDDGGAAVVLGFLGGSDHDGTFRLRPGPDGPELWIEAFLGGARLAPGECRQLHPVHVDRRDLAVQVRLGEWASRFGTAVGARTGAPYQVGWCSWYHYFFAVTEADVRSNLAAAQTWPFEVFQVDDGYQHDIGDWLRTNDRFPSGVDGTAQAIAAEGLVPGLWLAPFVARPTSDLARAHPDFFARHDPSGAPLVGLVNDGWGGEVWTLDTTRADVLDHLEATAGALVAAGFRYLKLDFTYAPSLPGGYADATRTLAQPQIFERPTDNNGVQTFDFCSGR